MKSVGTEQAQPLQHGVMVEGPWSVLLRAMGSDGGVAAGTWGSGTHHSTPLPAPGAACASLEEPWAVGTPQGCLWATVGAAAMGRGYGSCPPEAPELRGLPGHHGGCSQYPSLGDTPACAAYDAGAGCSACWDVGVHGPRRPRRHSDARSGEGPGTCSPSAMENPGVESPQSHSELPFPMMLQEGPRVLHPRNRATAVGGLLSLW